MALAESIARIKNRYRRSLSTLFGRRLVHLQSKVSLISFTFDDFPKSALHQGGAILKNHGCRATYYTSMSLMGKNIPAGLSFTADDLLQAVADGHELGCHTYAHCHAWNTMPCVFEDSIFENKRMLAEIVPGADFASLSYPIDHPRPETKRRTAGYFKCARGGGQTFNLGPTDANNLQAFFLEKSRDNPKAIKQLIDDNRRACGWLIFATHDICENPSTYGCTPDFFDDIVRYSKNSGSQILPVGKAWDFLFNKVT